MLHGWSVILQKSFKITLLLLGLAFILFYGFLEARVVNCLSYISSKTIDGVKVITNRSRGGVSKDRKIKDIDDREWSIWRQK